MATMVLEGFKVRPATVDDLAGITEVANICSREETGEKAFDVEDLHREWTSPGFNMETDTLVVKDDDERVIGILEVWDAFEPHVRVGLWGRVLPEYRGRGIGSYLMHMGEIRAREAVAKAPANARVIVSAGTNIVNKDAAQLFLDNGYSLIRYFWEMEIKMTEPPPAPVWPEGVTVRTHVVGNDDHATFDALEDAFKDHWGFLPMPFDAWKHFVMSNPDFDPSLYFLAVEGDEIAGLALCMSKTPQDPNMGWVDDLGVRRQWRKRGVGLALLHHAFGELYRRGKTRVGLGVDSQSLTGATRLYERAGMHQTKQWARYEKELRPGEELRTMSVGE